MDNYQQWPLERFPNHPDIRMDDEGAYKLELLYDLRDRLSADDFSKETLQLGYALSREIGDTELYQLDVDGATQDLLEATRFYARPVTYVADSEDPSIGGSHDEFSGTYLINPTSVVNSSELLQGLGLLEGDRRLIKFLNIAAHEAGHALLSGISNDVNWAANVAMSNSLAATSLFMIKKPQFGFTGNWHTDVSIQEERFAEGYGRVVTHKALEMLGYSKQTINKVMKATKMRESTDAEPGQSRLDYLSEVQPDQSLGSLVLEQQQDSNDPKNMAYEGGFGYALPLTSRQVSRQIKDLGSNLRRQDNSTIEIDVADAGAWHKEVKSKQHRLIRRHIKQLRSDREYALHPWRYRTKLFGATALASLAFGTVAAYITNDVVEAKEAPQPSKVTVHTDNHSNQSNEITGNRVKLQVEKHKSKH